MEKWISIKDGLPEVGKTVLVITSNGKYSCCSMYVPTDCRGVVLGNKTWKGSSSFTDSITHWMPIPKLENN